MRGEVVGINTAINPRGQGIGFAIPINLVRGIMDQLRETGSVTRGWLGVQLQEITPELADSLGLKERKGALIAGIFKDNPADKAGMKVGDVVVEFDGRAVESDRDFVALVGRTLVGKKVKLKVVRSGREKTLEVEIARRSDDEQGAVPAGEESRKPFEIGISLQDITRELAERLRIDDTDGVLVTEVDPGSAADRAGVSRGDIIIEVNRKAVASIRDFKDVLKDFDAYEPILFLMKRGKGNLFIVIKPEKDDD